jgi:hypothetical protein
MNLTSARAARARRYANAVIAWRTYGNRWLLYELPARYRADGAWVRTHLIGPRDRQRARVVTRGAAA